MRLLVVDVGNTSTAVGLWSDGRVSSVAHFDGGLANLDDLAVVGSRRLSSAVDGLDGLAYVSVVPRFDAGWRRSAKERGLAFHQLTYRDFRLARASATASSKSATYARASMDAR